MIQNKLTGFTLLELLLTLFIANVLFMLCQSDFRALLSRTHAEGDAYRFFQTLAFARQEAIKHNRLVSVCPTLNHLECTHDWSQGYMVFFHLPSTEKNLEMLRYEHNHLNTTIVGPKQTSTIQFTGDGRCLNRATFQISTEKSFKIILYDSGRMRLTML